MREMDCTRHPARAGTHEGGSVCSVVFHGVVLTRRYTTHARVCIGNVGHDAPHVCIERGFSSGSRKKIPGEDASFPPIS